MLTQIDWEITNYICEQVSTLGDRNVSADTSYFIQKRMLFDSKEDL